MKVTAAVFESPGRVAMQSIELPEATPNDLVVRTTCSAISVGTERWALTGRRPEMKYPHVPGYLGVGVVESVGTAVGTFHRGDRVFFTRGRLPEPYNSNSWMGTHMSQAVVPVEYGVDWPPYVCKVPEAVDDVSAALAGLAAVAVQGADMLRITSKHTALVLGMGMIGQCSAQVLQARGARVVVADRVASRIKLAAKAGCIHGVVLQDGPIAPQVASLLPGGLADIVVDTTSVAPVVQQLGDLVQPRSQILLQGYYPGLTPLDLHSLHNKRPTIAIPCSQDVLSHEYALRLLQGGQLRLSPLVTHTFDGCRAVEAFHMLMDNAADFLAIILRWS